MSTVFYLSYVIEAIEDVFPRLLTLDAGLKFVLLRCFEPPEGVGAVHIAIEELRRFRRAGKKIYVDDIIKIVISNESSRSALVRDGTIKPCV